VKSGILGVLLAAGVSLAAPAAASAAAEHNLAETIERFESLRAADRSAPVQDLRVSCGHLELVLKSGNVAPVRAGEQVAGFFFQGTGTLLYRSVDPIEFPVMSYNVRKDTSLSVEREEKALALRDGFERLIWLSSSRPPGEVREGDGPSLAAAFTKQSEKFRRVQAMHVSHRFAQQSLDIPSSRLTMALLEGGKEDLVYIFDDAEHHSEGLYQVRKTQSSDSELRRQLFRTVLSSQPIGRDRRDTVLPRYLLSDVDLALSASDGREAKLSVLETVLPQAVRQRIFRFELHSVTYAVVGTGSLQPRFYRLRNVTDESGRALLFDHRDGAVILEAPSAVEPNTPLKIRFEIEGDFLIRPGGDNYWELGVEPWFPQPDLSGQYYTFHAKIRVKKPFVPFASGTTIARTAEGDENVLETRIEQPVAFAVVLAGRYEFYEEKRDKLTIRVASYGGRNERAMKQLAGLAFGIIEYYENFLGPFPFPEFDILEINEYGFGQAPPGVMFITREAFNPLMGENNQLFSQGVNERFAHEIAHQYWAHVVKMPSLEEQWLTESFAEYSAAIFLKKFKGQATYDSLVRHWRSRAAEANEVSTIPLANRIHLESDSRLRFLMRTGLIYDKGAYLLAVLHKELGDQMFLTFLKSYQKTFRWKFGSTKTVAGMLQFLTKKDYTTFFEANYWGTGLPP
jgi:hypothetical protein